MTSTSSPCCYALVPCAGIGVRAGAPGPKQYAQVAGRPMVAHTLMALSQVTRLAATLVVLAPGDELFERQVPDAAAHRASAARAGGATRAESVANGLAELARRGARAGDWVLVHDAARCLVRPESIDRLIDACWNDAVGGLLALPITDTLKQEAAGRVAVTLERTGRWAAQTPQMFRLGALSDALAAALARPDAAVTITDDASAIEAAGASPLLVAGDIDNIKLTWAPDFDFAERVLRQRAAEKQLEATAP